MLRSWWLTSTIVISAAATVAGCGAGGGGYGPGLDGGAGFDVAAWDVAAGDVAPRDAAAEGGALASRWWGILPTESGPLGVVVEMGEPEDDSSIPVRTWARIGAVQQGYLQPTAKGWQLATSDCWYLNRPADGSPDRFIVTSCSNTVPGTAVLRRAHATRIFEAPVTFPSALGFDDAGRRFAFETGFMEYHFWLWDADSNTLADLGAGTTIGTGQVGLPIKSVAFSPDGRHVAYLRCASGTDCNVAELMLYDRETDRSQSIASGVVCMAGFAHFSPDGSRLAYFANNASDGTGADLTLWSVADGTATLVASKMNSRPRNGYLLFGPSGRHLIYRSAPPQYAPFWNGHEGLFHYDISNGHTSKLADSARDLTWSQDQRFLAWSTSTGQVGLWRDDTGTASVLDAAATAADVSYESGLSVSPDGRTFAYLSTDGMPHLYDTTTGADSILAANGATCYTETFDVVYSASRPTRNRVAHFATTGSALVYWPTLNVRSSTCLGGEDFWFPFHWRDLATGQDIAGDIADRVTAFGPHGEVVIDEESNRTIKIWTPARGMTVVSPPPKLTVWGDPKQVEFTRDGSDLVVASLDVLQTMGLVRWTAADGVTTQIVPWLTPAPAFRFHSDELSGQILYLTGSAYTVSVFTPETGTSTQLLDSSKESSLPVFSASGRTVVMNGTRGSDQGIHVFTFGTTVPTLVEYGKILGVSDTHVFFQAPDGICTLEL